MKWTIQAFFLVAAMVAAAECQAVIILSENFAGQGGPLNGTMDDTGNATWQAGDTWLDNGTAGTTVAGSANGQAAFLPFTPQNGFIYTAMASVTNNQPNWIGFGFLPANPPAPNTWQSTNFAVRHSNAPGWGWMLTRNSTGNDQEGFAGSGTGGGQPWNGDVVSPANPVDIKLILNTMNPTWTIEWIINNVSRSTANLAAGSHDGAGTDDIAGIGFSHDRNSTANNGGTLAAFSLDCVPEPASLVLLGLGALAMTAFRRR